jgi:hypothetical protein
VGSDRGHRRDRPRQFDPDEVLAESLTRSSSTDPSRKDTYRSDQFEFAKHGVPRSTLTTAPATQARIPIRAGSATNTPTGSTTGSTTRRTPSLTGAADDAALLPGRLSRLLRG